MRVTRVTRVAVVDEYTEDGETVVLAEDGRVLALSPVPSAVLSFLSDGMRTVEAVTDALVAEFGVPPGVDSPAAAAGAVLDQLSELGLLEMTTASRDF